MARKSTSKTAKNYDLIIIGGGPVGLALAASLVRFGAGFKIAICDRRPFTVPDDGRASALAAGVIRVFDGLGLWDEMKPDASPIDRMEITDSGEGDLSRPLFLSFEGDVAPGLPYAFMVPNKTTIGALLDLVGDQADLLTPVEVSDIRADKAYSTVTLADEQELRAPLVVAADGARSASRGMMGIDVHRVDYKQTGVVATIGHELPHKNTAFEHFRPAGPFASLPLPGNRSSLVWTETSQEAARLKTLPNEELAHLIEGAMGSCLGSVEVLTPVQAYPLQLQIAREFIGERFALIGDAAHVVHPIAGQGLNLGLKDVAALAEVLVEAQRLGLDFGSEDVLERYQQWRRFDTALMAVVTDGMNRLFSNDIAPVRALRDFGLGVVDRMPLVKSRLIRHAAGVSGGPRLLEGRPI